MRTAVIVYDQGYISGGAAQIAIGEAIGLKKRGCRVIFFCGVSPVAKELLEQGIEVICLDEEHIGKTKKPKALIKGLWNHHARKKLEAVLEECDKKNTIVHVHGWTKCLSSAVFLAAMKKGMALIVTLHDYFTICPNGGLYDYKAHHICNKVPGSIACKICNCDKRGYYQKIYRDVRQLIQNKILKISVPAVIYITDFSKNYLANNVFKPRAEYRLNNFVELSTHERIQVEANSTYTYIGRISFEKGIDLFCKSIVSASAKGLVIGDGSNLEAYKRKYPQIEFVGWKTQEEIREYLKRTRALVVSSVLYETMGLTVIEMKQYGIPCIVPAECAPAEMVKDKVTGVHYSVGDENGLTSCIMYLQNDEIVKQLSVNFYCDNTMSDYSIDYHISNLVNIYDQEINR